MRLWSLHPSMLDRVGLVAVWREGLLAQQVLRGRTNGYRFHPQLHRFRACDNPVAAIATYLWDIADEARARGYKFDVSKIATGRSAVVISVTHGQLKYEWAHLSSKLRVRDPAKLRGLTSARPKPHPMLRAIRGGIEPWEVLNGGDRRSGRNHTGRKPPPR
jgi:hypothetical protein